MSLLGRKYPSDTCACNIYSNLEPPKIKVFSPLESLIPSIRFEVSCPNLNSDFVVPLGVVLRGAFRKTRFVMSAICSTWEQLWSTGETESSAPMRSGSAVIVDSSSWPHGCEF
jgi:hypothetical protein